MKMPKIVYVLIALSVLIAGCGPAAAPEMKPIKMLDNEFATGAVTFQHTLQTPDGDVIIETSYSTEYDTSQWHITTPKSLDIKAKVISAPVGKTIYIENMHADVSLICEYETLNGWKTDTMDDHLHTGTAPGFLITKDYQYEESFAIEGFSQTLLDGWAYYNHAIGIGSATVEEKPLTESNLINELHAKGQRLTFVYDILVQNTGDAAPHKHVFSDEFGVPVTTVGVNPPNSTPTAEPQ